ncbi:phospholipase A2 inhibitor and Ly6/PLAUR domain-containing protein-like [Python bivittatus]|uniref:Phospholipase A2 inhibitor and Ly6/PLAUR domain-containing protein-like n=1 Tax=Python bivittatus TaxID=176946 RepID=A0A9F3QVY1_PYTBI|nr:phospholipase A2 inhibitor and Ly6/PLAUR domain-containing protein-like [Python bivittatus]
MLVPLFYPISRGGQSSIQITAIKKVKDAEKSLTCRTSSTATQLCTNAECYSQQAESTIDGSKTPHDILTCLSSCKARDIKFTFGDKKYIRANGKCCVTDNCNSIPAVSNTDVKNSSLECPGCFEFKTYCEATLMKCPEKEDQCVNITGTFVDASGSKPFYGRGCTAVTERDIVLGDTIATGENSWFQISGFSVEKAKDSSWSVQESSTVTLLLSGLIGIQLTNFFY